MPLLDLFNLNLQYFAADDGGSGGAEDSTTDDDTTDDNPPTDENNQQNEDSQDDGTFDADYVRELRRENAKRRTQNKELEEKLDTILQALGIKDSDDTDPEELANRLQKTEQENRMLKIENSFTSIASELGADAELTLAVLNQRGQLDDLDPDDKNFRKDLQKLVKETIKNNPKLMANAPQKTGATPPKNQGGKRPSDMNSLIRRSLNR